MGLSSGTSNKQYLKLIGQAHGNGEIERAQITFWRDWTCNKKSRYESHRPIHQDQISCHDYTMLVSGRTLLILARIIMDRVIDSWGWIQML